MCFKFWRAPRARVTVLRRALCGALARCAVVPNPGCAPAPSLQPGNAMAGARAGAGSRAQRAAAAEAREKVEALCDADGGVFGDMILGLLDDPADLQRAMSVSKKWRGFAGHDLVWQRFCQPYPMLQLLQTRSGSSYRTLFCQRKLAEHRCCEETARTLSRTDYMLGLEVYDHAGEHVLTKLAPPAGTSDSAWLAHGRFAPCCRQRTWAGVRVAR